MRFFRKKGFTIIELIAVIAIIAVLLAMILPTLSSRDSQRAAAISAAKDFYSATQSLFTKYSKYENDLSPEMKRLQATGSGRDKMMVYSRALNGNYPAGRFMGIEVVVERGEITNVNIIVEDGAPQMYMGLFCRFWDDEEAEFERIFKEDVAPLFEKQDGAYYAYVYFRDSSSILTATTNSNTVRVLATAYCDSRLPDASGFDGGSFNSYEDKYLTLKVNGENLNGDFLGVCSSHKYDTDRYMGDPETIFVINTV